MLKRRYKLMRKFVYGMITGGAFCASVMLLCGGGTVEKTQKQSVKAAEAVSEHTEDRKDPEEEMKELLKGDLYGAQLFALYEKYPEAETVIRNREQYSDELVEYLVNHEEALEWVIDYPQKMENGIDEINQAALEPVDPGEYITRNGIPVYFQWQQEWGYASYGTGNIAMDGCGPTSLSMVASALTGDYSLTPKKIADMAVENGYYLEGTGTDWNLMSEGADRLGLNWEEPEWSAKSILGHLEAGHPVICSMGPGDFTDQGHFIVLTGKTSDGKILVNDPNSRVNSRKKWDINVLLAQIKGMWAYWK